MKSTAPTRIPCEGSIDTPDIERLSSSAFFALDRAHLAVIL
jgi:hypothetical protein